MRTKVDIDIRELLQRQSMSAVLQSRIGNAESDSAPQRETPTVRTGPEPDDPLQLLRVAIHRLNSSNGELQDQTQMANLLGEVQEALERANVVSRAFAQCEESVTETKFAEALQSLDEALAAYPNDAALLTRRGEVEDRRVAFASATTVRAVLEEAQWLVQQDRLDLAARLLKEKAAALPDQPALISRLAEIESLLPQWEQDREVHAALERVAALEEREQWQVALAIVEDTLQSYSASAELKDAAYRVKERLEQNERQNRLERRLRLIAQKAASGAWKQALTLLETTEKEFPGASELKPLRREVETGLRRDECDTIVTEIRQCLADGELEQAEQILIKGLEALGPEPALREMRAQLQSEKKYRNELRTAQALFGRHQLAEAERILTELVAQNRTEAQALLDAVRQARAVTEEESFCERGREKALKLMQQGQFAQAADLLDNLRGLFPGNPILERDLAAARAAMPAETPAVTVGRHDVDEQKKTEAPRIVAPPVFPVASVKRPPAAKRAVMIGAVSLAVVSAAGITWSVTSKRSQNSPTPTRITALSPNLPVSVAQHSDSAADPVTRPSTQEPEAPKKQPVEQAPKSSAAAHTKEVTPPAPTAVRTLRPFVPPPAIQKPGAPQVAEPIVSAQSLGSTPAGSASLLSMNASLPPAPSRAAAPAPRPSVAPAPPANVFQEPQVIDRTMPIYPSIARTRGLFGVVRLEASVDARGNVKGVKVLSGDGTLALSASQAVAFWKYKPATINGKPVASTATIEVDFNNSAASGDSKK